MMWGSLWDSVREGELDPKEYVELVVKNLAPSFRVHEDELILSVSLTERARVDSKSRWLLKMTRARRTLVSRDIDRDESSTCRPPADRVSTSVELLHPGAV